MDRDALRRHLHELPAVSSHTHHAEPARHEHLDLDRLLDASYAGWCSWTNGRGQADRYELLEQLSANTYLVWLLAALRDLYHIDEVTPGNWDEASLIIGRAHAEHEHHYRLLTDACRYRYAVLDAYWDPGSDLGRPALFRPALRINAWAVCHSPGMVDHNGNSPWSRPGFAPTSLEEYLDAFEEAIATGWSEGCVALKSALAYDRTVAFDNPDREAARRAFRAEGAVDPADALAFGDVVLHHACAVAARERIPIQVHLGLGRLAGSRPMLFEPVVAAYPKVTFALFHCGYPWCDDVAGMLHNYRNVLVDFCWLPLISTTRAIAFLGECLDVAQGADRILWGDDTWTGEEAYGARLAWEHTIATVLATRVADGLCSRRAAEHLAERLLYMNAEALFG